MIKQAKSKNIIVRIKFIKIFYSKYIVIRVYYLLFKVLFYNLIFK